jgi:hypothetical protein
MDHNWFPVRELAVLWHIREASEEFKVQNHAPGCGLYIEAQK